MYHLFVDLAFEIYNSKSYHNFNLLFGVASLFILIYMQENSDLQKFIVDPRYAEHILK